MEAARHNVVFVNISRVQSLLCCLFLAVFYVLVFYIKKPPYNRDHPVTIKSRSLRAFAVCIISPFFVYFCSQQSPQGAPIWRWLGIHSTGIINATVLPLLLTMILFAGPMTMMFIHNEIPFMQDWLFQMDLITLRNLIVAPFTEEMVYRSCMIPLLVPAFGLTYAVLVCPLLFGVAHFHHAIERLQANEKPLQVFVATVFQFSYTTVFGIFSAFVFVRTGHLVGPFLCHSFCNLMGVPEFHKIPSSKYPRFVSFMFILGFLLFVMLVEKLTNPNLYDCIYFK